MKYEVTITGTATVEAESATAAAACIQITAKHPGMAVQWAVRERSIDTIREALRYWYERRHVCEQHWSGHAENIHETASAIMELEGDYGCLRPLPAIVASAALGLAWRVIEKGIGK